MRATEFITEYRNRLLQYVKSLLPTWPEYVLKDWLVPNKGDFSNLPDTELKNGIMEKLQGAGLTPDTKWQLVPDMKFTMDMFDPMTTQRLIGRAGGKSDLGMQIPRDAERHATQAALAQQQGGVRKEPVLLIKTANGYELLEGWHRTIQHFAQYPEGYTGPAWVAVAQGQQGVTEAFDQPYPMTWEHGDDSHDALAKLSNGTNLSIMFNKDYGDYGDEEWTVEFWRNNSQEVTGEGDQQRVFATVLSAIQQFIDTEHPARIRFSANKDVEPEQKSQTRSNLYTKLVQRYANSWGYGVDVDDFADTTVYNLHSLYEGVAEGTEQKPVVIYTNHRGATIDDDIKKSLRTTQEPFNKLQMWEKHKSMKDPKIADWVTNKLLPELKQNGVLKPLLVWNNNGQLFVIDGNHRFLAYQEAGYRGRVPVQIVPDNMIIVSDTVPGQQGVAEGLDEAVGGNYLYHATGADGLKGMLSSGSIRSATGPQAATSAQTTLPTVSVTRDWSYASGAQAQSQLGGIGRDAILVLDRNAVESNFKTLGTSQSTNIKGLSFNPYLKKDGAARSQNTDPMARTNAKAKAKYAEPTAKAGGEFEEAVVVPKGALPLKGTMVGFWVNPKSELMKDPAIMNDPRRLDMPRPNQFVKATQSQGVAENFADGKNPGRKGLSRRVGIPKKATLGQLEKIAGSSTGERRRMAQWQLNMRRGKKK